MVQPKHGKANPKAKPAPDPAPEPAPAPAAEPTPPEEKKVASPVVTVTGHVPMGGAAAGPPTPPSLADCWRHVPQSARPLIEALAYRLGIRADALALAIVETIRAEVVRPG